MGCPAPYTGNPFPAWWKLGALYWAYVFLMSDFSEASRTKKYFPWRKKDSKHTNQLHVCLISLKYHRPKSTSPKEKGCKKHKSSTVDLWPEYCVFQVSFFSVCFNKASNLSEFLASSFIYFDKLKWSYWQTSLFVLLR